jgi:hypothetical protein
MAWHTICSQKNLTQPYFIVDKVYEIMVRYT